MTTPAVTREARRAALLKARSYPPRAIERSSPRSFYWSVAQGLRALEYGTDDPDDMEAFTCYQCLDFDPEIQARFKEANARDIGLAAGLITSLSTDLKRALKEE